MIYTLYDTCVAINQCQKRDKIRRDFKVLSAGFGRGLRAYSGVCDDWLTDVDVEETNRMAEIVKALPKNKKHKDDYVDTLLYFLKAKANEKERGSK